jgi:ABC-2 type transport system permease protein
MNGNLYLMEMRRNLKGFAIWSAVVVLCVATTFAIIPTFIGNRAQLLAAYPADLLKAMGIDAAAWGSVLGVYASYYVFFVPLLGAVYAASLGANIIAREERENTAEFLLSRPLSRIEIVVSKMLVLLSYVTALWLLSTVAGIIGLRVSSREIDFSAFWMLSIYGYLLVAAFGFLALFLSLLVRRGKSIVGAGIGIVLGAYLLDVLGNLSDKGAALARLSPFHYLDTEVTIPGYALEPGNVLFFVVLIVACVAAALKVYRRKDIFV